MQRTETDYNLEALNTEFFIGILGALLILLIIVGIVRSLVMDVGGGSSSRSESKPEKVKIVRICEGCKEPFKKKDKFCGKCGYTLNG